MGFKLLGHQMSFCNFNLLFNGITTKVNNLQTVTQCRLYLVNVVCCSNEEHFTQVVLQLQVIIVKTIVLLRIQYLKQSTAGVSPMIITYLINLIQNHYRVTTFNLAYVLNNTAGHSTNVGFTVTSNFALVVQAT